MPESTYAQACTRAHLAGAGGCSRTAQGPQDLLFHTTKGSCVSALDAGPVRSTASCQSICLKFSTGANFYIFHNHLESLDLRLSGHD